MGRGVYLIVLALVAAVMPTLAHAQSDGPLIIAHRGASGERPEHTLAAYDLAIDQGADYIEPDLVITKDGVLVARHENEISGTTDVAAMPDFTDRKRTKTIDGEAVTGWFTEDFTLAELRTLRARERLPELRPANARFDGLYQVPTFAEIIALVKAREAETGKRIGLYPELKHPSFLMQETGIDTAAVLLRELDRAGSVPSDPVFIQSFEAAPLRQLNSASEWKLVQLIAPEGGPADSPGMRYFDMARPAGLAEVAQYADAIGVAIPMVLNADGSPTSLVADAHAARLQVHAWTLRKENAFLPPALRFGDDPSAAGNLPALWALLKGAQVDGVFTDDPLPAIRASRGLSVQPRE
ncbi:glycerophosphodiester phosphodiesterase family protein [Allopontixanthobacter sediminis]|uniref:glycerophosphodiester phosphodiesterase n=1 Tax=Allopontixanthobacter sediminis TaxID=1689985 RepID=A0A845AZA5_9SPHN|nr:glycerophosphodiester phosphodiesterase family protein [Allopontixanthobacter sediminis]MXP44823.1 glycerophosphodiester phosphodiesterase [Allopontixanthobacter sediminis]